MDLRSARNRSPVRRWSHEVRVGGHAGIVVRQATRLPALVAWEKKACRASRTLPPARSAPPKVKLCGLDQATAPAATMSARPVRAITSQPGGSCPGATILSPDSARRISYSSSDSSTVSKQSGSPHSHRYVVRLVRGTSNSWSARSRSLSLTSRKSCWRARRSRDAALEPSGSRFTAPCYLPE
jgi:hypothetical protein